jgi:hypothetical protein
MAQKLGHTQSKLRNGQWREVWANAKDNDLSPQERISVESAALSDFIDFLQRSQKYSAQCAEEIKTITTDMLMNGLRQDHARKLFSLDEGIGELASERALFWHTPEEGISLLQYFRNAEWLALFNSVQSFFLESDLGLGDLEPLAERVGILAEDTPLGGFVYKNTVTNLELQLICRVEGGRISESEYFKRTPGFEFWKMLVENYPRKEPIPREAVRKYLSDSELEFHSFDKLFDNLLGKLSKITGIPRKTLRQEWFDITPTTVALIK